MSSLNSKVIGGILFIIGTAIGGGMLVMPVSLAEVGMINSIIFLIACWAIMASGALLILEVNVRLPKGSNWISMAKSTLGYPGQVIAWISYLLLLYTLLSAYIAGAGNILSQIMNNLNINISTAYSSLIFTLFFSIVIYSGMKVVDYFNRTLMFGKLGIYLLLVIMIGPHIKISNLTGGSSLAVTGSLMFLITSFGFATIVPTLCDYLDQNIKLLRKIIFFGSLIPLFCYLVWITAIMGVLPHSGYHGLVAIKNATYTLPALISALHILVKNNWINGFFDFFTTICILTAFLGVSIGLFDFLADGFNLRKRGRQGFLLLNITFIPPLIVVIFHPGLYLHAFSYAGICCVVLLLLLPVAMAWKARIIDGSKANIMVPFGNYGLTLIGIIAIFLLGVAIWSMG